MKIFELISYKTCYYYLKDTSNLDLSDYIYNGDQLKEILKGYKENDTGYLSDAFYDNMHGSNAELIELKTNSGSIIFHKADEHDYIKDFLKENSKNAPCAFFASFRTSDDYMYVYAENGEIKRFLCNSEEGCYLEGEKTQAEIECDLDYSLEDEYSFIEPYIDEDDIVNIASKIIPFNIEEDIEILEINYYTKKETLDEKTIPTTIKDTTINDVHSNLKKNNDTAAGITLYKSEDRNVISILSFLINGDTILYSDVVNSRSKDDVIKSICKCLNVLADENYYKNPTHIASKDIILGEIRNNNKLKSVIITTNLNRPNTVSVSKINSHSLLPKTLQSLLNIKVYNNFKKEDINKIYDFFIKYLK